VTAVQQAIPQGARQSSAWLRSVNQPTDRASHLIARAALAADDQ
jgi:hypothetical protein